jgi:hypothetical protein
LNVPDSWRWWVDPLLHEEPGASILALVALALMVVGAIGTIRTGRWSSRGILLVGAVLWPLPDQSWQGPVVAALGGGHGIHLTDLLSVVAGVIAILPWPRRRRRDDETGQPTPAGIG